VIKGKTVKEKMNHVKIEVGEGPVEKHLVILSIDVMYLMRICYLVTVSRDFHFITTTALRDQKKKTMLHALKYAVNVYNSKGHTVEKVEFSQVNNEIHTILADNEFEVLREEIEESGIKVNISAKEEHVPEVERQIRVIKEQARAIVQTLPYSDTPKKMKVAMIHYAVFWLNLIPKSDQDYSPKDLILGEQKIDYKILCQLPFGAYVQVHDDKDVTNNIDSRTTGAINLEPIGNVQGTHKFLSLKTGEILV